MCAALLEIRENFYLSVRQIKNIIYLPTKNVLVQGIGQTTKAYQLHATDRHFTCSPDNC